MLKELFRTLVGFVIVVAIVSAILGLGIGFLYWITHTLSAKIRYDIGSLILFVYLFSLLATLVMAGRDLGKWLIK